MRSEAVTTKPIAGDPMFGLEQKGVYTPTDQRAFEADADSPCGAELSQCSIGSLRFPSPLFCLRW